MQQIYAQVFSLCYYLWQYCFKLKTYFSHYTQNIEKLTYDKNNWKTKSGFITEDGWTILPIAGFTVESNSTLERLEFNEDLSKRLVINGDFNLEQGQDILESKYLIDDTCEYYNSLIRGGRIICAKFNKKYLEIEFDVEPTLKLRVDITKFKFPFDSWEYYQKNGWIAFP